MLPAGSIYYTVFIQHLNSGDKDPYSYYSLGWRYGLMIIHKICLVLVSQAVIADLRKPGNRRGPDQKKRFLSIKTDVPGNKNRQILTIQLVDLQDTLTELRKNSISWLR
jgi:hypothetical protein